MTDRERKYKRHLALVMQVEGCKMEIKTQSKLLHRQINTYNRCDSKAESLATSLYMMLHDLKKLEEELKTLQADIYIDIS